MKDTIYRIALVRQEAGTGYSRPICYTVNYDHALLIKQGIEALIEDNRFKGASTYQTTSYGRPRNFSFHVSIDTFSIKDWFLDYFEIEEHDVEEWFGKTFRAPKERKK